MNNDEKKEYLNLKIAYQSNPFTNELMKKDKYLSKTPKTLYKYRKFDKFTLDMIENDYVFLAPAGKLDDPFDCLTNIDMDNIYEKDTATLTREMMGYIVDIIFSHPHAENIEKENIIDMLEDSTVNGIIDEHKLKEHLDEITELTNDQKHILFNVMSNFNNTMDAMTDDNSLKNLILHLHNSKEKVGVCSFTTNRDNKPMWSLYANVYKGYCIEYEIPFKKEFITNLCPVIYTKESDNNIVRIIVKFGIETIIRFISNGLMKTNMGCFTELLCTKDSDWEHQDEWRLIGDACTKVKPIKIKNIYLGFNVSKKNQNAILELAKRKEFGVFKMNKPNGNKKISYSKIV